MLRRVARGQGNESRKAVSLSLTLSLPLPPFLSLSLSHSVPLPPSTLVLPKSTGNSHPRQDATFRVEWLDSTNVEQWLRFYYRCGG